MSLRSSSSEYPTASLAAIFAIGKPVALDARAEERDTRGFISITTILPVRGSTENWMFDPPWLRRPLPQKRRKGGPALAWSPFARGAPGGPPVNGARVGAPRGGNFF